MDPFKAACHIQRIYRGRLVRRDYFWDTIRKNYHDAFDTIISVKLKAGDPHEHNHLHYDEDGVECFEWYYCDCCEKDILEINVYSNREEDFDLVHFVMLYWFHALKILQIIQTIEVPSTLGLQSVMSPLLF